MAAAGRTRTDRRRRQRAGSSDLADAPDFRVFSAAEPRCRYAERLATRASSPYVIAG